MLGTPANDDVDVGEPPMVLAFDKTVTDAAAAAAEAAAAAAAADAEAKADAEAEDDGDNGCENDTRSTLLLTLLEREYQVNEPSPRIAGPGANGRAATEGAARGPIGSVVAQGL